MVFPAFISKDAKAGGEVISAEVISDSLVRCVVLTAVSVKWCDPRTILIAMPLTQMMSAALIRTSC